MAGKVAKAHIMNLLELRFDYQSARNVYSNWRKARGSKEDPAEFAAEDVASLADYLESSADSSVDVAEALRRAIAGAGRPGPEKSPGEGPQDDGAKPPPHVDDKGRDDDKSGKKKKK